MLKYLNTNTIVKVIFCKNITFYFISALSVVLIVFAMGDSWWSVIEH